MGKLSKNKGKKWEQAVARVFRAFLGDRIHRGNQSHRGGRGAGEGADVDGGPFWVECKHEKSCNLWKAMRQADAETAAKGDPRPSLVVAKQDKKPPGWRVGLPGAPVVAMLHAEVFADLLADYMYLRGRLDIEADAPIPSREDPVTFK